MFFFIEDSAKFVRSSPYAWPKPRSTALQFAFEMHLRELERRHGHCLNQHLPSCTLCTAPPAAQLREYRSLLDERSAAQRQGEFGAVYQTTKAMRHVLDVHRLTFHGGIDPAVFSARFKR